jgi:hypothetical protein
MWFAVIRDFLRSCKPNISHNPKSCDLFLCFFLAADRNARNSEWDSLQNHSAAEFLCQSGWMKNKHELRSDFEHSIVQSWDCWVVFLFL